jgi:hypothetical protein
LDPVMGAFSVVNALRPLDAHGGQGRVLLAFSPPDCCEYQEILTLRWVMCTAASAAAAVPDAVQAVRYSSTAVGREGPSLP